MTESEEINLRALCAASRIQGELAELDALDQEVIPVGDIESFKTITKEWLRKLRNSYTTRVSRKGKGDGKFDPVDN